jgi:hypothetical protein
MEHLNLVPETAWQLVKALYWAAWILLGLFSIVGLTSLAFVWHECYRPARRKPYLRSRPGIAPHFPPQASRPRFVMVRLAQIVLRAPRHAAPLTAQGNAEREYQVRKSW